MIRERQPRRTLKREGRSRPPRSGILDRPGGSGLAAPDDPFDSFRKRLRRSGDLDEQARSSSTLAEAAGSPFQGQIDIPGQPGRLDGQMLNLGEMMMGKAVRPRAAKTHRTTVSAAWIARWIAEDEADKLARHRKRLTQGGDLAGGEFNGIVFIDEIDKMCASDAPTAASAAATFPVRACSAICCR